MYCLHLQDQRISQASNKQIAYFFTLKKEAGRFFKTSLSLYQATRQNVPENSSFHITIMII
jgi:hypothetical protein